MPRICLGRCVLAAAESTKGQECINLGFDAKDAPPQNEFGHVSKRFRVGTIFECGRNPNGLGWASEKIPNRTSYFNSLEEEGVHGLRP